MTTRHSEENVATSSTHRVSPESVLCVYDGKLVGNREFTEFPADPAYMEIVDQIMATITAEARNFDLRPASVETAMATLEVVEAGEERRFRRVILYNQQYFVLLPQIAGPWARHAVLAHEIGHHLNFHSDHHEVDPQREIQADRFAGRVLARLGAKLEEATSVLTQVSEWPTRTHPGRPQRRAAMVNGWLQENPEILLGDAILAPLSDIRDSGVQRARELVVEGTRLVNGRFLLAERIVFRPGASLVFSREALAWSNSASIVAREIVSEDPQRPGAITWAKPPAPELPAPSGQAPSGRDGNPDGGHGEAGQPGGPGPNGYDGDDAPSLILAVQGIGGGLLIDLEGNDGGPGGRGQKGGDGGNGTEGSRAVARVFWCERGAGDGGNGGPGGNGGAGGRGGKGGRGGTLTLLTEAGSLEILKQRIELRANGGEGGPGGPAGEGGDGGAGGRRGAPHLPLCKDDGKDGVRGSQGDPGKEGEKGPPGADGRFFFGSLTEEQIRAYLEPPGPENAGAGQSPSLPQAPSTP